MPTRATSVPCQSARRRKSGFALVIALVLMGFIFLLLLSLSSMVSVDMATGSSEAERARARQNAMLGFYVAMGQLQELAGPDQRVTAAASVFTDRSPAPADENQNWIGVWDSGNWSAANPAQREFLGWLVSGPDTKLLATASDAVGAAEGVKLLAVEKEDGSKEEIVVARVDVGDNGGYAYWIADESLKASLMLSDRYEGKRQSNALTDTLRRNIATRNNLEQLDLLKDYDFNNEAWAANADTLLDWRQLSYLGAVENADWESLMKRHRHDFTINAKGLLTDVAKGGWKRDLSLAFSDATVFNTNLANARVINHEDFAPAQYHTTSALQKKFYGPRWEILQDYHNLWKTAGRTGRVNISAESILMAPQSASSNSRGLSKDDWLVSRRTTSFGALDSMDEFGKTAVKGQAMSSRAGANSTSGSVEVINNAIVPVLTYAAQFFTLESFVENADNPADIRYKLRFGFFPVIHYWNPYNVQIGFLQPQSGSLPPELLLRFFGTPEFVIEYGPTGTENMLRVNNQGTRDYFLMRDARNLHTQNSTTFDTGYYFEFRDAVLEPGEIRVFSLDSAIDDNPLGRNTGTGVANDVTVNQGEPLRSAWNENAGVYVQNQYFTTNPITLSGDDVITVTIRPMAANAIGSAQDSYSVNAISASVENRRTTAVGNVSAIEQVYLDAADSWTDAFLVSSLDGSRAEMAGIEIFLKPGDYGQDDVGIVSGYNPAAILKGYHADNGPRGNNYVARIAPWGLPDVNVDTVNGKVMGYWGESRSSSGGDNFLPMFDIPRVPLHSIAQMQNANISIFDTLPAYAIGNSFTPQNVDRSAVVDFKNRRTFIDYSWMLNRELWDAYFFSTVPEVGTESPAYPGKLFAQSDITDGMALPNSRYRVSLRPGENASALYDYGKVAAQLTVDGAFNVNSTSVLAWKTVLGALGGEGFSYSNTSGNSTQSGTLANPFFRHSAPRAAPGNPYQSGWVDLNDAQLERLAENIVEEVKLRGPFMSMADFVNRRLGGGTDETSEKGALQAAIDKSAINTGWQQMNALAPGYLSQADVLTAIGPVITVRGDTFLIRAYGCTRDTAGNIQSEAWLEATVRRAPEHLGTDTPYAAGGGVNIGRGFVVDSFRWLGEDEI